MIVGIDVYNREGKKYCTHLCFPAYNSIIIPGSKNMFKTKEGVIKILKQLDAEILKEMESLHLNLINFKLWVTKDDLWYPNYHNGEDITKSVKITYFGKVRE